MWANEAWPHQLLLSLLLPFSVCLALATLLHPPGLRLHLGDPIAASIRLPNQAAALSTKILKATAP
jgi:hypothetical protein